MTLIKDFLTFGFLALGVRHQKRNELADIMENGEREEFVAFIVFNFSIFRLAFKIFLVFLFTKTIIFHLILMGE